MDNRRGDRMKTTTKPDPADPHHAFLLATAQQFKDALTRRGRRRRAAAEGKK